MKLTLRDLSIGYNRVLCSGINFSFELDKVHVFMGNNGLGKTTLFRTIAGLVPSLNGQQFFEDSSSFQASEKISTGKINIVFLGTQRPAIDYLSVKDFLSFGFVSSSDQYCDELLNRFNLMAYKNSAVSVLSDGQFKKIALVRQLLKKPKVLLLDEPSAYLDIDNKDFLVNVLKELKKECILFVSTHDVDFAKKCGDKFYTLKDEKIHHESITTVL